jgi:hypothetical protein
MLLPRVSFRFSSLLLFIGLIGIARSRAASTEDPRPQMRTSQAIATAAPESTAAAAVSGAETSASRVTW